MTWLDDVEANAATDGDPDEALARLVAFARAVLTLADDYDANGDGDDLWDYVRALAAEHLGES